MNPKVVQKIIEFEREKEQRLFKDYVYYEENKPQFYTLDEDLKEYIRNLNAEYKNFIQGKVNYNALSLGAKHKASNKVTRACIRRDLVETNNKIKGIGYSTNVDSKYSLNLSGLHISINNAFIDIFGVSNEDFDALNISGLYALNEFKKAVLHNLHFGEDTQENQWNFNKTLRTVEKAYKDAVSYGKIRVDDVDVLKSPMSATSASKILENLSAQDIKACLMDCKFNKYKLPNAESIYGNKYNYDEIEEKQEEIKEYQEPNNKPIIFSEDGYPLTRVGAEYFYENGNEYFGNTINTYNPETDIFTTSYLDNNPTITNKTHSGYNEGK